MPEESLEDFETPMLCVLAYNCVQVKENTFRKPAAVHDPPAGLCFAWLFTSANQQSRKD